MYFFVDVVAVFVVCGFFFSGVCGCPDPQARASLIQQATIAVGDCLGVDDLAVFSPPSGYSTAII